MISKHKSKCSASLFVRKIQLNYIAVPPDTFQRAWTLKTENIVHNCLSVSDEVEDMPILWHDSPISKYSLKRNENISLQKDQYKNCYSNYLHNRRSLETTQVSMNRMDKLWAIQIMGCYSAVKKEQIIHIHKTMDKCWAKEPDTKEHASFDSLYMKF